MRLLFLTTALASIVIPFGYAEAGTPCEFYGGHVDIEGKVGSKRDIGEASIFMPLSCSERSLLFTDLRIKRDNSQNMEGNFGLGIRQLYNTGIWGNYLYYDRKISGITDKYHTQLTLGSEWLAESWEVRANAYVPVTGEKSVTTNGGLSGGVNFNGNNIFLQQVSGNRIVEEPMYGADVEAGFKIPDSKFWLHAGGYTFSGNDVEDVTGGRVRGRYDLTENISLSAEGQYDDVRGRQGWIGVRFTLPFGGPSQKPEGLKARMTSSPVRDVDIVTQSKKQKVGQDALVPVLNANTGVEQRVLYVDNTAAAGGDGSKDTPFNNLNDVNAQLQDNDIVYIYNGNGTSAGLDQGFNINRNNVQVIGSGTNFVYDNNRFTTSGSVDASGIMLIGKTYAPTLTNVNAWQNTLNVNGADTTIAGINIDSGQYVALSVFANGVNYGNLSLRDVAITNNGANGINIQAENGGQYGDIRMDNVTTSGNNGFGTRINVNGGGAKVNSITINNLTSNNNATGNGVGLFIGVSEGEIGNVSLSNLTIEGNASPTTAVYIGASGSAIPGSIASVSINNAKVKSNTGAGFFITAGNLGRLGSVTVNNALSEGNAGYGYFVETFSGGEINLSMQNSTATQNQYHGVRLQKDLADPSTVDLGGGGNSTGGNRFFGNGLSNPAAYWDIDHGFGPVVINAQGNWWGQAGGPIAGQLNNPAAFNTTGSLGTDPNP